MNKLLKLFLCLIYALQFTQTTGAMYSMDGMTDKVTITQALHSTDTELVCNTLSTNYDLSQTKGHHSKHQSKSTHLTSSSSLSMNHEMSSHKSCVSACAISTFSSIPTSIVDVSLIIIPAITTSKAFDKNHYINPITQPDYKPPIPA